MLGVTLSRANCPLRLSGRGDSSGHLFGLCDDSESMHRHLKMTLLNGRARGTHTPPSSDVRVIPFTQVNGFTEIDGETRFGQK